jgi:hypothetical protein
VPKKKPASSAAKALIARLQQLEHTRSKMEHLFSDSRIAKRDLEHAYGAIFLAAFSAFEGMIEDLFLKLLAARISPPKGTRPLIRFRSDLVARNVVFGGRNYVDWFPYDRTTDRAKLFFASGRPFSNLDKNDSKVIEGLCIIRNALAHKSHHARHRFDDEVIAGKPLLPKERTPAGYLRSLHSIGPNVTRYEQLVQEITELAQRLVH